MLQSQSLLTNERMLPYCSFKLNPLIAALKPQSNGPII